jgi:hypothetical protein
MKRRPLERLPHLEMRHALDAFKEAMKLILDTVPQEDMNLVLQFISGTARIPTVSFFRYETSSSINFQFEEHPAVREFFYAVMYRFYALAGERDDFESRLCVNLSHALNYAGPHAGLSRMWAPTLLWTGTNTVHDAETHEGKSQLFRSTLDHLVNFFTPVTDHNRVLMTVLKNNRHLVFAALVILIFPELTIPTPSGT